MTGQIGFEGKLWDHQVPWNRSAQRLKTAPGFTRRPPSLLRRCVVMDSSPLEQEVNVVNTFLQACARDTGKMALCHPYQLLIHDCCLI